MKLILIFILFISTTCYGQYKTGDTLIIKVQTYECGRAGFPPDTAHVVKGGISFDFFQNGVVFTYPVKKALEFWRKEDTRIIEVKRKSK